MPDTSGGQAIPQTILVDDVTIEEDVDNKIKVVDGFSGEGRIFIPAYSWDSVGAGEFSTVITTSAALNHHLSNNTPQVNDNISYKSYLAKGTYTLKLLTATVNYGAIIGVNIDDDEKGTIDTYSAGLVYNVKKEITDIVISSSGLKTIKLNVNGKHASSTDYQMYIHAIELVRTA